MLTPSVRKLLQLHHCSIIVTGISPVQWDSLRCYTIEHVVHLHSLQISEHHHSSGGDALLNRQRDGNCSVQPNQREPNPKPIAEPGLTRRVEVFIDLL